VSAVARLRLDVADLLDRPGATRSFSEHLDVPANGACPSATVDVELQISSMIDGLGVSGTIHGESETTCSRCLNPLTIPVEIEVREAFLEQGQETDEDEAYLLEGSQIDLEPLIRDSLTLNLPAYPRCREDCEGLCPSCGTPRASGCDCKTTDGDPRLAALANIKIRSDDARPEA
jgi:uncharacterized protein